MSVTISQGTYSEFSNNWIATLSMPYITILDIIRCAREVVNKWSQSAEPFLAPYLLAWVLQETDSNKNLIYKRFIG